MELVHDRHIQFTGKRPLHSNNVAVWDARCLAGGNTRQRRQHAGVKPCGVQRCKGGQFLGTGGQQDIARFARQVRRGLGGGLQHHTACRQVTGGAQQAVIFHTHCRSRRADVAGSLGGIGVGGIHAEGRALQKCRHGIGIQAASAHCDAGGTPLLFSP